MLISQNEHASGRVKINLNAHFEDSSHVPSRRGGLPSSHSVSLLLILNNCSYTKDVILPQIHRSLVKLGFPDMVDAIQKAKQAINVCENASKLHFRFGYEWFSDIVRALISGCREIDICQIHRDEIWASRWTSWAINVFWTFRLGELSRTC